MGTLPESSSEMRMRRSVSEVVRAEGIEAPGGGGFLRGGLAPLSVNANRG